VNEKEYLVEHFISSQTVFYLKYTVNAHWWQIIEKSARKRDRERRQEKENTRKILCGREH